MIAFHFDEVFIQGQVECMDAYLSLYSNRKEVSVAMLFPVEPTYSPELHLQARCLF